MAKTGGIVQALFVDGRDLSGNVGTVDHASGSRATIDVTCIDKVAVERIAGLQSGEIAFNTWWDNTPTATTSPHAVLSALPLTDRLVSWWIGTPIESKVASLQARQVDYAIKHGEDSSVAATITATSDAVPLEWGIGLTVAGKQTFANTAGGAGTSVDDLPGGTTTTAFGAVAYLHVFSVATNSVVVAVQDSANNADWADVTGLVFTTTAVAGAQRLATATTATIRRYLRINCTSTFTNAVVAVAVTRYQVAQG